MTDTPQTEPCAKWTLTSGDVTVEVVATLDGNGNVVFDYELVSGVADLNGFYIDINNDGGTITRIGGGNNMNGSDSDGERLDGFDYATAIGTVGGNDTDTTSGSITIALSTLKISTLEQLAGAEIGIRATSVGINRDGSLKLADTGEFCPPEEPDLCDRPIDGDAVSGWVPQSQDQITQVTLSFFDNGLHIQGLPTEGDVSGDGYYTVTINVPAEMAEDPDAFIHALVEALAEQDPFIREPFSDSSYYLKSIILTDCHGEYGDYYAIETDINGEGPDPIADGLFNDADGIFDGNTDVAGHVDATYTLQMSGDEFILA